MVMFITISSQIRTAQLVGDHMSRQVSTDMGVVGSLQMRPDRIAARGNTGLEGTVLTEHTASAHLPGPPLISFREYLYSFRNAVSFNLCNISEYLYSFFFFQS